MINKAKFTPSTATQILENVLMGITQSDEKGLSIDDFLDSDMVNRDLRRSVSNILFTFFRHRLELERRLNTLVKRPPKPFLKRVMLVTLTQIYFSEGIAPESAVNVAITFIRNKRDKVEAGFANAVLRNAIRNKVELKSAAEDVIPPALYKYWKSNFSKEDIEVFTNSFLTPASNTFRCKKAQELTCEECETLGAKPLEKITPNSYWQYYTIDKPVTILEHPDWATGRFYFQDPATSVAMSLPSYAKIKRALDICAAPGGKALMAKEMMGDDSLLIAADRSARRQELTKENFKRCGMDVQILNASPWDYTDSLKDFDLVVADVPCSNTGVFRRRPDALWHFKPKEQQLLHDLQYKLLKCAASRVKMGGELLYSTCSIERVENSDMIANFLNKNSDFEKIVEQQILPSLEHDGAYSALLRRKDTNI